MGKRATGAAWKRWRSVVTRQSLQRFAQSSLYLFLAAVVALSVWGSLEVRRAVRQDESLYVDTWRLSFTGFPSWVTPEMQAELEATRLNRPQGRLTVLDPGVVDWVKSQLEASAWVGGVEDIRICYPTLSEEGAFAVRLLLREPVALVAEDGLYYLTDGEARRLGAPYREAPGLWFQVPLIIGLADAGTVPSEGERWASQDVRQGVEVARILHEAGIARDYRDRPIHAIDLSNLHGRLEPRAAEVILWQGKQRLAWGRSPLSAGARSAGVGELLANLRWVLSHPETFGEFAEIHLHRSREHLTGIRG